MSRTATLIAALVATLPLATPGFAQDAEAGKKLFNRCAACHQVGAEARNRVGPVLEAVVGRRAGSFEGFKYGSDMIAAGDKGLVWTEALLADYLADPSAFLRSYLDDDGARSKMSFRLKDETQRLDVAAYLAGTGAKPEDMTEATPPEPEPEPAPVETRTVKQVIADQTFTEEFLTDPDIIATGKGLWDGQCTLCHGAKAYPGKAPKLKPYKYKPTFVFKRVYKGFKGMPNWRDTYTIDEIRAIVAYIKSPGFAP